MIPRAPNRPHGRQPVRTRARFLMGTVLAIAALGAAASTASGFGTWDSPLIPGYAEHERITRMAIQCDGAFAASATSPLGPASTGCAQARTATMVAGTDGYFGGVGAPDSIDGALNSQSPKHCDDGDFLFGAPTYPRPVADRDSGIEACRAAFTTYMDDAVQWAGVLVPATDSAAVLDPAQASLGPGRCNWRYDRLDAANATHPTGVGQAKCNVLISFGRAMHIAQDFFSHSNWIDQPLPLATAPLGLGNPPGLGRTVTTTDQVPDLLRYPRTSDEAAAFLAANQVVTGGYTGSLTGRVTHSDRSSTRGLNKDMGSDRINWTTGAIPKGTGSRGATGAIGDLDNFQRAAYAAATTTATAWRDLEAAVKARYPGARGELAWKALREDTPWSTCTFRGAARDALAPSQPPRPATAVGARAVTVQVINATDAPLSCGVATLDYGQWSPVPPDAIPAAGSAGFRTQNRSEGVAGTAGSVQYRSGDTARVTITWDNPTVGGNTYRCSDAQGLICAVRGGRGNDAKVTVTISRAANGQRKTAAPVVTGRAPRARGANHALGAAAVRTLAAEVPDLRPCGGPARRINLAVDDVSCAWASAALSRLGERLCPAGWTFHGPRAGGPVLCHLERPGTTSDSGARALRYILPHFAHAH